MPLRGGIEKDEGNWNVVEDFPRGQFSMREESEKSEAMQFLLTLLDQVSIK